ncbi:MAG: hypothetical protein ABIJ12_06115 [bacterium]
MSYTNIEMVRHHLATEFPIWEKVYDQLVVFDSDEYISFFSGAVDEVSLVVKSLQSNEPERKQIILGNGANAIDSFPLQRGSVVVASDSSVGRVYTENVDYIIDYTNAQLYIKDDGSLAGGDTVIVWYVKYALYINNTDYQIDNENGKIRRMTGGDIAPNETVLIDYTQVYKSHTEEVLNNAVLEANNLIENEIDPDQIYGADPVLQAAATYRALEIICQTASARELSSLRGDEKSALAWLKLAEIFAIRSDKFMKSFHPPIDGPNKPTHS